MALHEFIDDRAGEHQRDERCPCGPVKVEGYARVGAGRNAHQYRGVIIRHQVLPAAAEVADRIAADPDPNDDTDDQAAQCGHIIAGGQHHQIPDDGAPHAPTSECGCGPRAAGETGDGHLVFVHVDQAASAEQEQLHREVYDL